MNSNCRLINIVNESTFKLPSFQNASFRRVWLSFLLLIHLPQKGKEDECNFQYFDFNWASLTIFLFCEDHLVTHTLILLTMKPFHAHFRIRFESFVWKMKKAIFSDFPNTGTAKYVIYSLSQCAFTDYKLQSRLLVSCSERLWSIFWN